MGAGSSRYKVKLSTGRVLGPLDLERVRKLILRSKIVGEELARIYPDGEWQNINIIPELAELLIANAEGKLSGLDPSKEPDAPARNYQPVSTRMAAAPTQVLPSPTAAEASADTKILADDCPELDGTVVLDAGPGKASAADESTRVSIRNQTPDPPDDQTLVAPIDPEEVARESSDESSGFEESDVSLADNPGGTEASQWYGSALPTEARKISEERTVLFQRNMAETPVISTRRMKARVKDVVRATVVAILLGIVGYQLMLEPESTGPALPAAPIRAVLPGFRQGEPDPEASNRLYVSALHDYVEDTIDGYRRAAYKLRNAAGMDPGNIKALAMLASCYLNLIDSLNKDENYFSVIYKLIEMAKAKAVDLPELVIADTEFFNVVNKSDAAQTRIVEYTKIHQDFPDVLFFYLSQTFFLRGDYANAASYMARYPDTKVTTPRIFHLKGLIAEKLGDYDIAIKEYEQAIKLNKKHALSRLRIAEIKYRQGKLKDAAPHLALLTSQGDLLPPKPLAQAYFLNGKLAELLNKPDIALANMELAVRLDKGNPDYLLDLYTLRAKNDGVIEGGGKKAPLDKDTLAARKLARMYYFLGEGEKLLKQGDVHGALTLFLSARQENDPSPIPLVRIGDMFRNLNDITNARMNYKLAADRAPSSIEVWSKYIDMLIRSYEWDEAQRAMQRFTRLPVNQSAIDKLAADIYEKQGMHEQAQVFYKRAMARDSIDPDVYIAYANSLMATKNYKEAPFFYALALRFDPLNADAIIGTAKSVAAIEGPDRGIAMLQDQLGHNTGLKGELLSAIAELNIQRGEWEEAQRNVEQAMAANPDLATPWRLQALIYLNQENQDKRALNKALSAFESYSERNPSDPSGYFERFRIYIKQTAFDKAIDELNKIYVLFPKYPNLHYHRGSLYSVMGNHTLALQELKTETADNPNNVVGWVALGKEFLERGALDDALQSFAKAMAISPKSAEARQEAAYTHYLMKNFPAAVALYSAAVALDPGNPIIYKRMGLAYRDMGDPAAASEAFKRYLELEPDAPDRLQFQPYR